MPHTKQLASLLRQFRHWNCSRGAEAEWSSELGGEPPEEEPEFGPGSESKAEKGLSPDITPPLECCVLEARDMSDWNATEWSITGPLCEFGRIHGVYLE
jgi:hypothetical protein